MTKNFNAVSRKKKLKFTSFFIGRHTWLRIPKPAIQASLGCLIFFWCAYYRVRLGVGASKKNPVSTESIQDCCSLSDLVRIQTWNLLSRNQVLYSIELRGLFVLRVQIYNVYNLRQHLPAIKILSCFCSGFMVLIINYILLLQPNGILLAKGYFNVFL